MADNFAEIKSKPSFNNLRKVLPQIEEAQRVYDSKIEQLCAKDERGFCVVLNATDFLAEACREFNAVAMMAVEAIYQDTKSVNTRERIYAVYGMVHPAELTLFGCRPLQTLKGIVETGNLKGRRGR